MDKSQSGRMVLMFQRMTIINRPASGVEPVNIGFQELLLRARSVFMFLERGGRLFRSSIKLFCKSGDRRKGKSG